MQSPRAESSEVDEQVRASEWHARPVEDVLDALGVDAEGLSDTEAGSRLERVGPNRLPTEHGPSSRALLADQIRTPLMYALLAAAAVAMAMGEIEDGVVVLAVVVLNTLIGFVQEYRAGRAIAALAELVAEPATARRDGHWVKIPAEHVVPGDVLAVAPGDRVAADARVIHAERLSAQEGALTGESVPVEKSAAPVAAATPLAEHASMLHAGTTVAAGAGIGVAVGTGARTEVGRIATLLGSVDPLQTPLTRELDRLGRVVTVAIGVAAVLLVAVAALRGFPAADAMLAGISVAVAAVPEGLPAVVTIALAVGVRRMARRRAIIRHLPAVETLGSVTLVASDKTGTLTRNEMTVQRLWTPSSGALGATPPPVSPDVVELLRAGVLCNDAAADGLVGDPTEIALLAPAAAAGVDVHEERQARPRIDALPFDPETKLMATLHTAPGGEGVMYVKGAPEAVLPRCRDIDTATATAALDAMADEGQRILVLASRAGVAPGALETELHDLRLLGMEGMLDPPRDAAPAAVAACLRAGVRVVMVTGDHPRTARAIGDALGLPSGRVVTGPELDAVPDAKLGEQARTAAAFARAAPVHKLRLVRALQADGEVVAVTGDGFNDAPALRQADIGVAMGQGGTAAAKEAADMVLADDDFGTLRVAIEEGRRVYDNLVKALAFVLPTSLGQALIVAVAVLVFPTRGGAPQLPVEPVEILWVNLIVAVGLALPLAFETAEPGLMERPPRDPRTPLLDTPLLVRTVVVSITLSAVALALFEIEHARQLDISTPDDLALARAQTTAVTGAVVLQAIYLIGCRSLVRPTRVLGWWSNPAVYAGIAIVLGLQVLFVTAPFMHAIFGSATIDAHALALAVAGATLVIPVTAAEERWRVRRQPGAV